MADLADGTYSITGDAAPFTYSPERISVVEVVLDFSKNPVGNAEGIDLIEIPAKTLVLCVASEVKQVEGATLTIDLGDHTDDDEYLSALDCNALSVGTTFVTPTYYAAASAIMATINHAGADTAIVVVKAVLVNLADAKASYV